MTANTEIEVLEGIRREICRAVPPGVKQGGREWAIEATRFIREARRERDEARDALEQLQHEYTGLCEHHTDMCRKASEDMAKLRAERDAALAAAER